MKSYPDSAMVRDGLGDKVIDAIRQAVALAAADLDLYRRTFPLWVAQHSERGLANWIHDRAFWHLLVLLDGTPGVTIIDREPKREVNVGVTYRLRMKRHDEDGHISTYPTLGAEDFFAQGPVQLPLDGLEEVRLAAGYEWDSTERSIGNAVLTLRSSRDKILWKDVLPAWDAGEDGLGGVHIPIVPGPTPPTIDSGNVTDESISDESVE